MVKHVTINVGDVDVCVDDFIEQIDDDDLLEEITRRELGELQFSRDYAERAYEALVGGRRDEAIALLDRAINPTRAKKNADGQIVLETSR